MATLAREARPGRRVGGRMGAGTAVPGQEGASVREVCLMAVRGGARRNQAPGARVVLGGRRYRVSASAARAGEAPLRYVHLTPDS